MNQVGEVCSVQLNRKRTVAVKKKEQELPQNGIGKVSHRDTTPSFFLEALANQNEVQSSKEDLLAKQNLFTGAS